MQTLNGVNKPWYNFIQTNGWNPKVAHKILQAFYTSWGREKKLMPQSRLDIEVKTHASSFITCFLSLGYALSLLEEEAA